VAGPPPKTTLGELTVFPQTLSWFLGSPASKGIREREEGRTLAGRKGVQWGGKGESERRKKKRGKGKRGPSQLKFLATPLHQDQGTDEYEKQTKQNTSLPEYEGRIYPVLGLGMCRSPNVYTVVCS